MDELRTCPFCGGDAMVANVTRKYILGETEDRFAISCIFCGANGGDKKTKEEAIEIWNRRTENKQCKLAEMCRLYAELEVE